MRASARPLLTPSSRLVDLDTKLNGILAQLSGTSSSEPKDNHDAVAATTSEPISGSFQHALLNPVASITEWPSPLAQPPIQAPETIRQLFEPSKTPLPIESICSPSQIEQLLTRFRQMQSFFPFVVIPADWTAADMLIRRPFLLLAAITNSAMGAPEIASSEVRDKLSKHFKETLASRVIVDAENNLDLIQGLLVHLAW